MKFIEWHTMGIRHIGWCGGCGKKYDTYGWCECGDCL